MFVYVRLHFHARYLCQIFPWLHQTNYWMNNDVKWNVCESPVSFSIFSQIINYQLRLVLFQWFIYFFSSFCSILLFLCLGLFGFGTGYPTFQQRIPNGEIVPSPCNPNHVWQGVGHLAKLGGGENNQFGLDFKANGYVSSWEPYSEISLSFN